MAINLTDYASQMAEAARARKMAEALQAQALSPIETQTVNGNPVPISGFSVLAKALAGYAGGRKERMADEQEVAARNQARSEAIDFMKTLPGTSEFTRMNPITAAESNPNVSAGMGNFRISNAPLAEPTAPPEMINTAKPFVAAGTPPQKMAQALQSSMANRTQVQAPQAYGNAAPTMAPQSEVITPAHTNTPQEKMAMLMQGMTSGNPYMEKFAPAMYDEARQEEKSGKVFKAIDLAEQNGADPKIMAAFKAANDPGGAVSYLAQRGLKKEDAEAAVAAYRIKAADTAAENALNRESRADIAAQQLADRAEGRAQASVDRRFLAELAGGKLKTAPAKVQQDYVGNVASASNIDQALSLVSNNSKSFGLKFVGGDAINQRIDPNGTDARAAVSNIGSQIIHDRSGAAVTISEYPRLKPFIPRVTDEPDIIKKKLNGLRRAIAEENSAIESFYTEDNGYRPFKPQAAPTATGGTKLVYNKTTGELEPR